MPLSLSFLVSDTQFVLVGPATVSAFQSRLQMMAYSNSVDEPVKGNRTLSVRVNDGRHYSNLLAITISVSLVDDNNLTILCSDGDNTTFTETDGNSSPIPVVIDPSFFLLDRDLDHTIVSAVVELLSAPDGTDETLTGTSMFGLRVDNLGSRVTVSSPGKDFQYQALLAAVQYNNVAPEPTSGTRTVSFTVNDGQTNVTCVKSLEVVVVNDNPPVVDLNGPSLPGIGYSTRVTYSFSVQPIAVTASGATVTDLDGEITELRLEVASPQDDEGFVVCESPMAQSCVIT